VNITAVILTFVSAISSSKEESILTPVQLLWVNLIMDTFAALALATDPPSPHVLDRKPEPRNAPLVSVTMWKMILGQAMYQLIVVLTLNFAGARIIGYSIASPYSPSAQGTVVFNTYVWMQFFNQYNSRRLDNKLNIFEGLHRNWYFIFVNIVTAVGQVLIIFYGDGALSTVPLDRKQWAISLFLGALSLPIGVMIRLIPNSFVTMLLPQPSGEDVPEQNHVSATSDMQDIEAARPVSPAASGLSEDQSQPVHTAWSSLGALSNWLPGWGILPHDVSEEDSSVTSSRD
jgi:Ca2+-transporting ATPase